MVIGLGMWVKNNDLEGIWIYSAKQNPTTKQLEINGPSDVRVEVYATKNYQSGVEDMSIRTFDYVSILSNLKRTYVTGFGASTKNYKITKMALKLSRTKP